MKQAGWAASIVFICAVAVAGAVGTIAMASEHLARAESIESFYGAYEGQSISISDDSISKRDLAIAIVPRKNGFNLTWTTVTYVDKPSGVRKTYSIDFVATRHQNLYASAMRTDMFGNRVPLNPLEGDPFVWAALNGKTLSVYALLITPTGGYEMQIYHRTLTSQGLRLEFSRIRDGTPQKFIAGTLVRIG